MKKIIYLLFLTLFVLSSCNQEDETIDNTIKSKKEKVTLCHKGKIISVNGNALKAHLNHGDIQLIDADGDGWVELENNCVPGGDCNDLDPLINPGVGEICGNNIDDDCDGDIDEDCRTYVPDDNFERHLIYFGHDDILDDYVLTSNIETVTELYIEVGDNGPEELHGTVRDLTGIEDFAALTNLRIRGGNFGGIDLSNNTNLTHLSFGNDIDGPRILSSLNLNGAISLASISLFSTGGITSLDVSNNPALTELFLENNDDLINLNLKNGNNILLTTDFVVNSNLLCVQVDDVAYSNANWTLIGSPMAYFSEDCGY